MSCRRVILIFLYSWICKISSCYLLHQNVGKQSTALSFISGEGWERITLACLAQQGIMLRTWLLSWEHKNDHAWNPMNDSENRMNPMHIIYTQHSSTLEIFNSTWKKVNNIPVKIQFPYPFSFINWEKMCTYESLWWSTRVISYRRVHLTQHTAHCTSSWIVECSSAMFTQQILG